MKKINFTVFLIFIFAIKTFSQNEIDGLRYSQKYIDGTARFVAMSGAFGALGGDLSAISINPAASAVFVSGQFSLSPQMVYNQTDAKMLLGRESSQTANNQFIIGNLGYVSSMQTGESKGLTAINFGITYNRVADFNENYLISGLNMESTMAYSFIDYANGYTPKELWSYMEQLAYDTYVIDTDITDDVYVTGLPSELNQTQTRNLKTEGGMNEIDISLGVNFGHKIYFGTSLGFTSLNYSSTSIYSELNNTLDTNYYDVKFFQFTESLMASGLGMNIKLGVIARPTNWLRLGASFHSGTYFSVSEEYDTEMASEVHYIDIDGNVAKPGYAGYFAQPTDNDGYLLGALVTDYFITTPSKSVLSAAFVIKKMAILSFDFEYINYKRIKMQATDFDLDDIGEIAQEKFKGVRNLRMGLEIKNGIFSLRGGAAYYDSPYSSDVFFIDAKNLSLSGGFGISKNAFSLDFALAKVNTSRNDYFYAVPENFNKVGANITSNKIRGVLTFGIKF